MADYKFKAMKKMLKDVGRDSSFTKRPKLAKFKSIANSKDSFEENLIEIQKEIKNLENLINIIKNSSDKSKASDRVREMVNTVDLQSVEAFGNYIVAWRLLKKELTKKLEETKEETAEAELEETKEEIEEETAEITLGQKDELSDHLLKAYYESINDKEPDGSSLLFQAISMAEEAEYFLMEVEKKMANLVNDHPLEG